MSSVDFLSWGILLASLVVLAALVILVRRLLAWQHGERRRLRSRFGPEYARVVAMLGSQWRAVRALRARERRVQRLSLDELSSSERARFEDRFHRLQARFVDQPVAALHEAEQLIDSVLAKMGYPPRTPEQQLDDLSVHFAQASYGYRCARESLHDGTRDTEQLRRAFIQYRQLFAQLLHSPWPPSEGDRQRLAGSPPRQVAPKRRRAEGSIGWAAGANPPALEQQRGATSAASIGVSSSRPR